MVTAPVNPSGIDSSGITPSEAARRAIVTPEQQAAQLGFDEPWQHDVSTHTAAHTASHVAAAASAINGDVSAVRALLEQVRDPEIPVLTIADLGILREVAVTDAAIEVSITPTYSGCPAMDAIEADIHAALRAVQGERDVRVRLVLHPAWTTDWMSAAGKTKLEQFGIAPPTGRSAAQRGPVTLQLSVRCPQCGSLNTRETSRFGSTACKAQYSCSACHEPFDHFKAH